MPVNMPNGDIDKDYAAERNKLIPEAERYANKKHRVKFPGGNEAAREAWAAGWNFSFHNRMNELCGAVKLCPVCKGSGRI